MTKCAHCGCVLHINVPKKIWRYARSGIDLEKLGYDSFTNIESLIFLTNSGYEENVWICSECWKKWGVFFEPFKNRSWKENWQLWNGTGKNKEIVQFT